MSAEQKVGKAELFDAIAAKLPPDTGEPPPGDAGELGGALAIPNVRSSRGPREDSNTREEAPMNSERVSTEEKAHAPAKASTTYRLSSPPRYSVTFARRPS